MTASGLPSQIEDIEAALGALRADLEASYPIRLIGVFGSVARGDSGPGSDVDLLVEARPGLSLFKLGAVQALIEGALGRPVDLVFESGLKPRMRERIAAEMRPL